MAWAVLFLNAFVILLSARLRYADAGLPYAFPIPIAPDAWWWFIAGSGVLAVVSLVRGVRQLRSGPDAHQESNGPGATGSQNPCPSPEHGCEQRSRGAHRLRSDSRAPDTREKRMALIELLAVPAFLLYEWAALPPYEWRPTDWMAIGFLLLWIGAGFWRDRGAWRDWGLTHERFGRAANLLVIPTAVMLAVPLLVGHFVTGGEGDPGRLAVALATYPLWAFLQLLVFQVFVVRRLKVLGASSASIVLVAAGTFTLVHWPNGVVMAACFGGALVWTTVYLRAPNLYAVALSMGLAAGMFHNTLPRKELLHNLRTGPIYVERLLDAERLEREDAALPLIPLDAGL